MNADEIAKTYTDAGNTMLECMHCGRLRRPGVLHCEGCSSPWVKHAGACKFKEDHGRCFACGRPNLPSGCCSRSGCCNSD